MPLEVVTKIFKFLGFYFWYNQQGSRTKQWGGWDATSRQCTVLKFWV